MFPKNILFPLVLFCIIQYNSTTSACYGYFTFCLSLSKQICICRKVNRYE